MDTKKIKDSISTMVSTRVTPVSKTAAEKISLLVTQFHSDVTSIINEDHHPKENVQIIIQTKYY